MTAPLMTKVEQHAYGQLFTLDLHWSAPDLPPIRYETEDGDVLTATNVSSYKGLRVWVCDKKPGTKLEALLDREIAKTSTDRIVIYHDEVDQVWRWPVRQVKESSTTTRLTSHRHRTGIPDPKFEARLDAIRLPTDKALDPNAVLAKVRAAFDVEAQNETKRASKLMARMYTALEKCYPNDCPPVERDHQISVTLARILFLMFGDDTEMWATDLFRDFIHEQTNADGSDIGAMLNDLFVHLDTLPVKSYKPEPRIAGFPYVNGGIFEKRISLPVVNEEFRDAVLDACAADWATISPAIFGSMFQSVRDAKTRRELGEHYTSEENILKTLNPLFLDELRAEFERATTMKNESLALRRLRDRLGEIRYMDPACGCGNFIIIAYRELRDLELRIMERLQEINQDGEMLLANVGLKVTLDHFYGIEIDEWPARIAETAMFLIDRQCDLKLTERLGWAPHRLPIQEQATIAVGNALRLNWADICSPSQHVIVAGNPPFLGKAQRSSEQTADMRAVWGTAYSGEADYVTSWFARAAEFFGKVSGRWAFVATNSVTQGVTVAPVFAYLFEHGWQIKFAHRAFTWTSEAVGKATVHCVIVGFTRELTGRPRLFEYATSASSPEEVVADAINAYLVDGPNVLVRDRRRALSPRLDSDIRFGSMAADDGGLFLSPAEYSLLTASDPVAIRHVRPFIGARELLHRTERWCIWMPASVPEDIEASPFLQQRIKHVRKFRMEKAKDPGVRSAATTPYRFNRIQQPESAYLCIPAHVSETRPFFLATRFAPDVIAGNANFVVDDPDGFFFAIISSSMFITWQRTVGGRLKSDLRFASTYTWNTFPLPEVDDDLRTRIIDAGSAILAARNQYPDRSLADHYTPGSMDPDLRKAHAALDAVIDEAFGATGDTERERQHTLFLQYESLTAPLPLSEKLGWDPAAPQ